MAGGPWIRGRANLQNVTLSNQLSYRAGAGLPVTDVVGVSLDLGGQVELDRGFTNVAGLPLEAIAGGWFALGNGFTVRAGVGAGLSPGIGAPVFRALGGLSWSPVPALDTDLDADADGVVDTEDACRLDPEDHDGFEDGDGCPDPDNDSDGVADGADLCPLEPEDLDGVADDDGCPDGLTPTTVQVVDPDGAPVTGAQVVLSSEGGRETVTAGQAVDLASGVWLAEVSAEGFVATQEEVHVPGSGSATLTLVIAPHIPQAQVQARVTGPEGQPLDGVWIMDGGDAVPGSNLAVVVPPGDHEVLVSAAGFAPAEVRFSADDGATVALVVVLQPSLVQVTAGRIDILQKVYFETGKAQIRADSHALLDEVAMVLSRNPDLRRVRVEGHTDSRGSASSNQRLSQARASAVQAYLVERGVAPERLEAVGYGESEPVDPAQNDAAWEANRRVVFTIMEQAEWGRRSGLTPRRGRAGDRGSVPRSRRSR